MKASAMLFWATLAGVLGQSLGAGSAGIPYKRLYVFHTIHGPIYIAEWKKRFYPIFREESLGSYATPEDAAEELSFGRNITIAGVNLASLRIPKNLKKWERL